MYDENSFKNYIFWLQVKRVFLMIIFAIVGAIVGIVLSQFLIDVLLVLDKAFKAVIITVSTLLFWAISLLLTAGTGKEVQEGYWKMAVLRKLTVISKKLDCLENLDTSSPAQKEIVKEVAHDINQEINQDFVPGMNQDIPEEENESAEAEQITAENSEEDNNENIVMDEFKNSPKIEKKKKHSSKKTNTLKITRLAKK